MENDKHEKQCVIHSVRDILLDEEIQNDCWFQIVNTIEDMSNEPTFDEVIKLLNLNYMIVPRNYR